MKTGVQTSSLRKQGTILYTGFLYSQETLDSGLRRNDENRTQMRAIGSDMQNLLLEKVEYKIEETRFGVWRRFVYSSGAYFAEFKSHTTWMGLPLLHYTRGKCPETGRRIIARGVIGVGRLATGIVAIGQASFGLIAIGQLGLGLLLGLGQGSTGLFAIGQLAGGLLFGLGQLATGWVAIGQFGYGKYVLAQMGYGDHVWSLKQKDPVAIQFFRLLLSRVGIG